MPSVYRYMLSGKPVELDNFLDRCGGEGGIRTHGRLLHLRKFSKLLV